MSTGNMHNYLPLAPRECSPGCGKAFRNAVQEQHPRLSPGLHLSAGYLHHLADMTSPAEDRSHLLWKQLPGTQCLLPLLLHNSWQQQLPLSPQALHKSWRQQLAPYSLCRDVLTSMSVNLGTKSSRFSAAVTPDQRISVTGQVKNLRPFLTGVGGFDVDLALEVSTAARARLRALALACFAPRGAHC